MLALREILTYGFMQRALLAALLVIPGATAYRLSSNYRSMLSFSLVIGLSGSFGWGVF